MNRHLVFGILMIGAIAVAVFYGTSAHLSEESVTVLADDLVSVRDEVDTSPARL